MRAKHVVLTGMCDTSISSGDVGCSRRRGSISAGMITNEGAREQPAPKSIASLFHLERI